MKYISVKEAIKTLGVSRSSLYKLINNGILKTYSLPGIGRRTFIDKEELEGLFKEDTYVPLSKWALKIITGK
jgi:excisionase family DNA binding protein